MKRVIKKKIIQVLIGFISAIQGIVLAQPTPGDTGLGSLEGGVVGGGADLGSSIWLWLIPAILYFVYKWRENIFHWYLNLDWGDYS